MSLKAKLWHRKKLISVVSVLVAVVVGLVIWFTTSNATWASISGILLAILPNGYSIYQLLLGVSKVVKLGWKEAETNLLEREEKIQRLLRLDEEQRRNPEGYLKTDVESISHKGLTTTAPHVMLSIRFYNLSVHKCKLISWKLRIERPDDCHVNCQGKPCQLRPQGGDIDTNIKPCEPNSINIRLDIQETVSALIDEVAKKREQIYYNMHIDWQVEIVGVGEITFRDYLSYSCIPNLAA